MYSTLHQHDMPIWQTATARDANRSYFKLLASTRPGTSKKILGKIIGDIAGSCSYMIVRRSHREPHQIMQLQTCRHGARGMSYMPRTVYKITKSDYVIARQAWSNGEIEELEAFDTPAGARQAFRQLTGRGYTTRHSLTAE